jgi:hypothetical protein
MSNGNRPLTAASRQAACITGTSHPLACLPQPAQRRPAAAVRVTTSATGNAPPAAAPTTSNS